MKTSLRTKAVLAAVLVAATFTFASCAKAKNSNQFKVGMECAYAPFNWTQNDNKNGGVPIEGGGFAGGYDVEIAKKIAAGLGKELVIVKTEWDGLSPAVTSGKIDAIIAGMSATDERKKTIDFSNDYYTSDLVIVVKKGSTFASAKELKDFANAKITAQQGTLHYDLIDQIKDVKKQTAMPDFGTMLVALTSGKIDGYISERPGALSAAATNPDITFVGFEDKKGFDYSTGEVTIAVGLNKNSPLTENINKVLAGISKEERAKIMDEAVKNQPAAN